MMLKCAGDVCHFDADGPQYSTDGWSQCLAVMFAKAANAHQSCMWDTLLMEFYSSYGTAYVLLGILFHS